MDCAKSSSAFASAQAPVSKNPPDLECLIAAAADDVIRWYRASLDAAFLGLDFLADRFRTRARDAATEVGRLVGMRSTDAVCRMEKKKGLQ